MEPNYSLIIPVYNLVTSLPELVKRIDQTFSSINETYEIIFGDDGSEKTETLEKMKQLQIIYPEKITIISLFTNSGQQSAILCGIKNATGKYLITLDGDLASGKTTFAKGILLGLNYKREVTSPTFTLINEYEAKHRVIHIDCYRENNLQRWVNLGIQDYFYSNDVKIIEWPEIISSLIPEDHISITLSSISEFERKIYIK